jgi:hypothetical protein
VLSKSRRFHTPEAEMVRGGVGLAFPAGAGHVAGAVLIAAEKGAAAHHSLRHAGLGGVRGVSGAGRVSRDSARGRPRVGVGAIPVASQTLPAMS